MKPRIKYAAIYANKDRHEISNMCSFFQVSRSGYYDWLRSKKQPDKDEPIGKLIQKCQQRTKQTYGYRRMKIWLLRETGLLINHKAVLRIMRKYNLQAQIRRPRPLYIRQQKLWKFENRLNREFHAERPNQKWATDISYIFTKQGILYLSMIKDLYDNFIVAYDMGTTQDNALVFRTLEKAKKEVAAELVLHSDQGFQYTSPGYLKLTKEYGILPSMSRAGTPLDNACAENFFGTLKAECIYLQNIDTIQQAKTLINDYIYFYNYERIQLKTKLTPYEKRCQLM